MVLAGTNAYMHEEEEFTGVDLTYTGPHAYPIAQSSETGTHVQYSIAADYAEFGPLTQPDLPPADFNVEYGIVHADQPIVSLSSFSTLDHPSHFVSNQAESRHGSMLDSQPVTVPPEVIIQFLPFRLLQK